MIWPSKKVLSIFILTAGLVGAIIIAFGREKGSEAINFASNLVVGEKISIPENTGWQNELQNIGVATNSVQTTEATTTQTATDILAQSLMANYLSLKQSGTLDQTSAQKLVDQSVSLFDELQNQADFDIKLNLIPDNGRQTIADYGENLGMILKNNKPAQIINEVEIINEALNTKNEAGLSKLDSIITTYSKTANDLAKMPVPKTFEKAHLDIFRGIKAMAISLGQIKNMFDDPVTGLSALQIYTVGQNLYFQSMKATVDFINQNKVVYKQSSGGYYLLYGI